MGLIFGGLRVAAADSTASQFGQVRQLALLGQQVTGLVQALEDERDLTAGYVAAGRPATRVAQLQKQYAVTDAWAARVGSMADGIGTAYPAQTQAKAGVVLARLSDLAGLRATAASNEPEASPLITGYSTTISELLAFNDEIAQDSANSVPGRLRDDAAGGGGRRHRDPRLTRAGRWHAVSRPRLQPSPPGLQQTPNGRAPAGSATSSAPAPRAGSMRAAGRR
jgi:hypothetical protein